MQDSKLFLGIAWSAYHQNRPTNNPISDPDMAHLPYDSQKCPRWQTSVTPSCGGLTEFRQPLQVQSHLEMPGILVQLGHIQRT